MKTTLGQLMINEALPEDMRDYHRVIDKKGMKQLGDELVQRYPDQYRQVMHRLMDVGQHAAYTTGGHSVGLRYLRPAPAARKMRMVMQHQLRSIMNDPSLSREARNQKIVAVAGIAQQKLVDDVLDETKREDNPLYHQLTGAGRGNKFQLNSLRGADLLYTDHRGEPIPIPVLHNYSEGLRPAEYFAGAFGARKGLFDLKSATADAGFLGKQFMQTTHRLVVTGHDDDQPYNEYQPRGLPVETGDPDNAGALLAHPAGGYPRDTRLNPKILKGLRADGISHILVRSPTVGGPGDGGVYAKDLGQRERGDLPPIGEYAGIAAAQSLSEPLLQSQLSSKHSGGVAGASAGAIGGFKGIDALVQVPKHFIGWATHAQTGGRVGSVVTAPQGGHYVHVDGKQHYVPVHLPVTAQPGQEVEAGDTLSEGTPNPAEIVKHKGIGEGRRYFTQAFGDTLKRSDIHGERRNIELLSRGLINHVRLTDELGDWMPDDVVPYSTLERQWTMRPGTTTTPPSEAIGRYLESPVLHYTIGTKVGKSMVKQLKQFGVNTIDVHHEPPPFAPEMIRGMASVSHDPDWATRLLGSYQQKSLLTAVHRGAVSDTNSTSFVPALAEGKDFGLKGPTKGWMP